MKPVVYSALLLIAFVSGCDPYNNPYQFKMGGPHIVSCEILTSLPGVDHNIDMATLRDTAAIDMNYYGATQYLIMMGVRLRQGEGFRILLRPVVEQRDVRDSGIVLVATRAGTTLDSDAHSIVSRPDVTIAPDQIIHVALLSENNYMQIVLDCDTVFRGFTRIKESDDVVVQALNHSEVDVIKPDWSGLPDR